MLTQSKKACLLMICISGALLSGCNQGDDRLAEKARIEGRESARAQLEELLKEKDKLIEKARAEGKAQAEAELTAQNENLGKRSREMEDDLSQRQRFYQAVSGTYEGSLETDQGSYRIRLTFVPSLPAQDITRVRTLEEIASDLTQLSLSAQIVQWNPSTPMSAVGCRVQQIRPDLKKGEIVIASEACPSFYSLRIADPSRPDAKGDGIASDIKTGAVTEVPEILGMMQPTTHAMAHRISAFRTRGGRL